MTLETNGPGALLGATGPEVQSNALTLNSHHNTPETQRSQLIHVELSERRRRSGDTFPVATCHLAEVEGSASPICSLARELLRLGLDPTTMLSIWRGSVRCFHDLPISAWAGLTIEESSGGPVFRRWRPPPGAVEAPQASKSDD